MSGMVTTPLEGSEAGEATPVTNGDMANDGDDERLMISDMIDGGGEDMKEEDGEDIHCPGFGRGGKSGDFMDLDESDLARSNRLDVEGPVTDGLVADGPGIDGPEMAAAAAAATADCAVPRDLLASSNARAANLCSGTELERSISSPMAFVMGSRNRAALPGFPSSMFVVDHSAMTAAGFDRSRKKDKQSSCPKQPLNANYNCMHSMAMRSNDPLFIRPENQCRFRQQFTLGRHRTLSPIISLTSIISLCRYFNDRMAS